MIIVTGSNGFIGKHLVRELRKQSHQVWEVDQYNKDVIFDNISPWKVDKVYHLGAISDTTETDIEKIYNLNIKYSINLLKWCRDNCVPVAYASSASVYGNGDGPLNYYALSKLTVDLWVKDNIEEFDNIHGYRFFNVYGEGEDHKGGQASPVTQFTKQAKENGVIRIFDNTGDGERDFIWVGDVCRVMLNEKRKSGIYDCGTGTTMKFSEVAHHIAKKYNATVETIPFPDHLKGKYQYYTCAKEYDDECITLEEYLLGLRQSQ